MKMSTFQLTLLSTKYFHLICSIKSNYTDGDVIALHTDKGRCFIFIFFRQFVGSSILKRICKEIACLSNLLNSKDWYRRIDRTVRPPLTVDDIASDVC